MKIPLSLIKEFIDLSLSPAEIAELLTLAGIEVDKIENETPAFSHVVVGEIVSVEKHPKADKLSLVHVNDGNEVLPIVCGAPNCKKGMKVPLAKIGATLLDEEGKKETIQKTNLRGVDSYGMLCSAKELRLSEEAAGILELSEEFTVGKDLASILWDPVFEISLTPNLGHCASALGIARELSALTNKPLFPKKAHSLPEEGSPLETYLSVSIEAKELCSRYGCRLVDDLQEVPTPFWLKKAIESCGFRSLHPLVDILNYLMIAYGHPMHAFDFDKIEGKKIIIHKNDEVQTLLGLDGKEYTVPLDTLLISDAKKPLVIAGILGLENSAISSSTRRILIEAAHFDPISIRKSCKTLNLKSESSFRFERGVDRNIIPLVLDRAAFLIHSICKGSVAKGKIDLVAKEEKPISLSFRTERANKLLGTQLSPGEMESIFHRLSMSTKNEGTKILVTPPSYRNDIKAEIDLVEEAARIYGYNNIEKKSPRYSSSKIPHSSLYLFEKEMQKNLFAQGLQELMTSDLMSPKLASLCEEMHFSKEGLIEVLHSKSADYSILRPSLLPSLLQVVQFNLAHQRESLSGYEIGRIHFKNQDRFIEENVVGIVLYGKKAPHHWKEKPLEVDFYDLKGIIENLLQRLGISSFSFAPSLFPFLHPGRQAKLLLEKKEVAVLGEVHPSTLSKLDINRRVYFAEINSHLLLEAKKNKVRFQEISSFPSSQRDWTLILSPTFSFATLSEILNKISSSLLEQSFPLDLYEDPNTGEKKITLRFIYRDKQKTLTIEEVEKEHEEVMKKISSLLSSSS